MKYVSFLFALALIGVVGSAFATEVKTFAFDYNNHNAYYACSYAESQVVKTLTAFGAENVETTCDGGIDNGMLLPISVDATFIHDLKGHGKHVILKGKESCDFNVKLIKQALFALKHDAEITKEQSNCWDASGRYYFEIHLK